MLRILNTNRPIILFVLPIYSLVFLFPLFWNTNWSAGTNEMPLALFFKAVSTSDFWNQIVSLSAILGGGYLLNYTVNKHQLLFKNTNISATVYILLMATFTLLFDSPAVLFANLFLIYGMDTALTLYNQNTVYSYCFRFGVLLGLAVHFYVYSIVLLPVFFATLLIIRTFVWRDWVITLLGLTVPFIYAWTYFFWNDNLPIYYQGIGGLWAFQSTELSWSELPVLGFGVLLFLGTMSAFRKMSRENVRQKNLLYVLLNYLLFVCIGAVTIKIPLLDTMLLLTPIAAIFLSILLQSISRRWMAETLLLLLLILIFSNHWKLFL